MANINDTEQWRSFIDTYRSLPAIWKVKSEEYKDKNKRNKAWEVLLNNLKEIVSNATLDDLKKKITNIRTCYRRELKKKEKSEKSGAGGDDMYEPSLWYFDLLHDFLGDQEIQIPGDSNLDESDDQGIGNTAGTKRKMRTTHDTTKDHYLQKAVEHLDFIKEQELMKDEAAIYADS
ncbi:uncharacterized protein [Palaemon carinicauda]|uniref:uncharacterized protein n=1 Tax=Palaemon carinicauda TaxID=392227 RepID=UPI0035B5DEC0